jgi:hypothetical protein
LVALIVVGHNCRVTAADSTVAEISRRLDRLEEENQELRTNNMRLEELVNGSLSRLLSPEKGTDLSLGDHRYTNCDFSSYDPVDQADPTQAIQQLGAGMEQLQFGLEQMGSGVEELGNNLTVTTANKEFGWKIALFGALTGEMILAEKRPIIPSAITLMSPDFGNDSKVAEVHAKSSYLGAALIGPQIGDFQLGGLVLAYFYGENVLEDLPGLFFARVYGELKNDFWRFSVGLDGDVVVPLAPTTVNWSIGNGGGNMGYQRGQFRVERYIHPYENTQWTLQFGVTDPTVSSYANFSVLNGLQESNGWPNIEGRLVWGCGPRCELAGEYKRTVEVGLSGLIGQLRRTAKLDNSRSTVADVWAYGLDAQVKLTDWLGIKGEFFHGQTIGSYNAAIVQNFNANGQGIQSTGGWGEFYVYWTPCHHSHFGYSIDNPRDTDLTAGLASRNEFAFANIFWDVTHSIEVGFEVSHWRTEYIPKSPMVNPINDAMIYHTRVRIKF